MTRYLDDDVKSQTTLARGLAGGDSQEAVVINRGWYIYHENGQAGHSAISSGRKRNLSCSVESMNRYKLSHLINRVNHQPQQAV